MPINALGLLGLKLVATRIFIDADFEERIPVLVDTACFNSARVFALRAEGVRGTE